MMFDCRLSVAACAERSASARGACCAAARSSRRPARAGRSCTATIAGDWSTVHHLRRLRGIHALSANASGSTQQQQAGSQSTVLQCAAKGGVIGSVPQRCNAHAVTRTSCLRLAGLDSAGRAIAGARSLARMCHVLCAALPSTGVPLALKSTVAVHAVLHRSRRRLNASTARRCFLDANTERAILGSTAAFNATGTHMA